MDIEVTIDEILPKIKKFCEVTYQDIDNYGDLYQYNLRAEEAKEWWTAWENKDYTELLDAIADFDFINFMGHIINKDDTSFVIFYNMGTTMAQAMGISEEIRLKALNIVCDSNLSKFDTSEEEANKTKEYYKNLGVDTYYLKKDNGLYITYVKDDCEVIVNGEKKVYPKDKAIKSAVNFVAPNFDSILEELGIKDT